MASLVYNRAKNGMWGGNGAAISLLSDTIKVMLVTSAYTANPDHDYITASGAGTNEIVATNYTGAFGGAGRKTLASKTLTEDDTNDRSVFDAADVTWTSIGGATNATIAAAILVKEGTSDADSQLLVYIDIADTATNGGDITIQWNANGIFYY